MLNSVEKSDTPDFTGTVFIYLLEMFGEIFVLMADSTEDGEPNIN